MFLCIVIISLIAVAVIAYMASRHERRNTLPGEATEVVEPPAECCGMHEVCEKDSLLAAVSKEVEYYDDEELDRFQGRASEAYTAEEEEEFRQIFYTMKSEEVAGWVRSLQLRGVELPVGVKDEVLLIVRERRYEA